MGSVAGIITAASTGVQTGAGFMQHQQSAQAASLRGRFENDVAERNAQIAERQGSDAINRGALAEGRERLDTREQVGGSRAALAAQGVDVSTGSAADVQTNERAIGETDALTIRNNAAREAWGYDVEAANQRMNGNLAILAGENDAATQRAAGVSTLLTGATSLYGQYRNRTTTSKLTVPTVPAFGSPAVQRHG